MRGDLKSRLTSSVECAIKGFQMVVVVTSDDELREARTYIKTQPEHIQKNLLIQQEGVYPDD